MTAISSSRDLDADVRGFSFMPTSKVEVLDLQYIESEELERTWKTSRRQRLKDQEQKVWDEFVKEKDSVVTAFEEDPYQFLHELPEHCLKDLMESELNKMKETEVEDIEQPTEVEGNCQPENTAQVTFVEEKDCDMFHIFYDDNDSGEEEGLNETASSPGTVRERDDNTSPGSERERDGNASPDTVRERDTNTSPEPNDKRSSKSSEDVRGLVESSVHHARVQELRAKINTELDNIMRAVNIESILCMEQTDLQGACRRATQFSCRFNRIYIYQIHRAMYDIKRNAVKFVPFARHTQLQAQMLRIVSLHQLILQALQVYNKSTEQTYSLVESGSALATLVSLIVSSTELCAETPAQHSVAAHLNNNEMGTNCEKLQSVLTAYTERVTLYMNQVHSQESSKSRISRGKVKRLNLHTSNKGSNSNMGGRLSMYSLESFRSNNKCSYRENQSSGGTSKQQGALYTQDVNIKQDRTEKCTKKKTPRGRRPLMRAPRGRGGHARLSTLKDNDISTMVEGIEACASSHISPAGSPRALSNNRNNRLMRMGQTPTTLQKLRNISPKAKNRNPKSELILKALSNINSDHQPSITEREYSSPVSKHISLKNDENETLTKVKDESRSKENTPRVNTNRSKDGNRSKDSPRYTTKNGRSSTDNSPRNYGIKETRYLKTSPRNNDKDVNGEIPRKNSLKDERYIDSPRYYDERYSAREEYDSRENHSNRKSSKRDSDKEETGRDNMNGLEKEAGYNRNSSPRHDDGNVEKTRVLGSTPARCEVSRLLRQLCSGDASHSGRNERVVGAKNAQLVCVNGGSPRQPSTPQLLRILEETIQKKAPKPMFSKPAPARDPTRYRLTFNIPDNTAGKLLQYRTAFVQHMLTSPMYANSAVGKPWEMIGSVSEKIIEEALAKCAQDMQIKDVIQELYKCETR